MNTPQPSLRWYHLLLWALCFPLLWGCGNHNAVVVDAWGYTYPVWHYVDDPNAPWGKRWFRSTDYEISEDVFSVEDPENPSVRVYYVRHHILDPE